MPRRLALEDAAIGGAPADRIRAANAVPVAPDREFVLYWMIAARRTSWSFALDRAVAWAKALGKPLLVLEALRVGYPWANDRLHRFVLDGMADNARALADAPVTHHVYVEPEPDHGKGLVYALGARACVVVTDEFPCFFLPRMVAAAAKRLDAKLEVVDGNGLVPLAAHPKDYPAASHFRRHQQKLLPLHLGVAPKRDPFARVDLPKKALPRAIRDRWPPASRALLEGDPKALAALPIDHDVPPSPMRGGAEAARVALKTFVQTNLDRYVDIHAQPDDDATSRLSPWLHFGHVSAHEVFAAVVKHERWTPASLPKTGTGAREGWWGMRPGAEAFLDQLVVWRELGYNTCARRPADYDRYESLPAWAQATLRDHAKDARPHRYSRAQLEAAETHDELWNAAQRQLLREGWFHNYLRMLWGKKILEWSKSPRDALQTMVEIMNRWSLDGRDPNSYSGYFWVLGRYDRPWPEREVYGKVRSMSSERTRKKVAVERYLEKYGSA